MLSGANTYSGGTTISEGAIQISSDANLGAAPGTFTAGNITLDGGTLRMGANFDLSNNRGINLGAGGGTIDTQGFTNPSGYTQPNGISGIGDLVKLGSGTFYMNAGDSTLNNAWMSNLVLREGTWKINGRGGLPFNPNSTAGLQPAQITFDGGTWQIAASITVTNGRRGITVAAAGGTVDTQSYTLNWQGPLAGNVTSAVLNKIGSGTFKLLTSGQADGTYAGILNVNAGNLTLDGGRAMGDLAAVNLADSPGVALTVSGAAETIGSLSGGGANGGNVLLNAALITGGNNNSTAFNGLITGGALTKTGSGSFTLGRSAGNTYTGTTTVSGGTLLAINTTGSATGTGPVNVDAGGTLGGTGMIQGNVTNGGTVGPGNSAGTLHLGGSYTQTSGGTLEIELATLANYDELTIAGGANLTGTLAVSLIDNFVPQVGDVFEIVTAADLGGSTFATTTLPMLTGGLYWNVYYSANAVTLAVTAPGDFNGDGTVDAADYVIVRKGVSTLFGPLDYGPWRTHFGQTAGSGSFSNTTVPEPAPLALLTLASVGWFLRRSRAAVKAPRTRHT